MTRVRGGPALALTAWCAITTWLVLASWSRLLVEPDGLPGMLFVAITLVGATGAGLRGTGLEWPFVLSGQLLTALLVLQAQLGSGWLPSTSSIEVAVRAVGRALQSAEENAAPVAADAPSIVPILLMGGVALHLVVDLVAVSLRHALAASLPLLAAWVLPVSVLGTAAGWPLFAVAAIAWLALLAADQDADRSRWGRVVAAPWLDAVRPGSAAAVIGAVAVLAAVTVPSLLPHRGAVTLPGNGPGRGGTVELSDPIADLQRNLERGDDVGLLRITVPSGAGAPTYVRLSVLDEYAGDAWRVGPRSLPLDNSTLNGWPRVPALELPGTEVPWDATVSAAFRSQWLPTPRWTTTLVAGTDWRYDDEHLDVHRAGRRDTAAGVTYDAVEYRPEIAPEVLAGAPRDPRKAARYAGSSAQPAWLRELAEEITRGAASDYERAVALQRHFQRNYRYSTAQAPGTGAEALRSFLTVESDRFGYCEQFAASMALLARSLGMPARISVGFLRPERIDGSTWEFSAHDLHAWPEIWFTGVGWVGFEPTPTTHTRSVPSWSLGVRDSQPSVSASPTTAPSAAPRPREREPEAAPESQTRDGIGWELPLGAGLAALLVVGACAPRVLRARQRSRRLATDSVEDWWTELRATAVDLGVSWPEGRSPRATGRAVARGFGDAEADEGRRSLDRLVATLERTRYAPVTGGDATREDAERCLDALRAGKNPRVVRRARWWPRSVLRS